ncbi:Pkinase-domain-containing protein [Daedalea quercina L-15889]|uniref:non-specific serine/threonine protein kinase n=1 Tax=Daedalea quercina L-15889 TaxID=1314783 RepID=A0A165KJJ8_9APHY|nr:Pkinase-domain-containing protein [Daedalea quercina L-15889]
MASPLDLYESVDVIGTGSFGIIRKVRRKADGQTFARKELNFDRMSERDRKQIVAEVNILKDLNHEHIVRYHDRHVDRDAGILYILMEYCGGGDLSSVIKQAQRQNRPIPEDTIWNYFMQILLALNYCHHPNGHGRAGSGGGADDGRERRPQILHRDLKPDNVFLDETNLVKLGDFGLSKALAQASFANTYVGTPYYMSPELMQEKAYDSKSDIWSLGCLIYELCALKPPFHEAKTHAELSILIRTGRIPPLPKGYSPALTSVIKAMLNLNPAMRPSAQQLLNHERIELAFKVGETQKLLNQVKSHRAGVFAKERDLVSREAAIVQRENNLQALLSQKDTEIATLRTSLATAQSSLASLQTAFETALAERVRQREQELRALVAAQEGEVATRMARREEEIMAAVRAREEEIARMWAEWEAKTREAMGAAVEQRMDWVRAQAGEVEAERARLEEVKRELERRMAEVERGEKERERRGTRAGTSMGKTPLEEVKNILAPPAQIADTPVRPAGIGLARMSSVFETPRPAPLMKTTPSFPEDIAPPSAMKGVILTATGEPVATPSPAEVAKLFINTPKVGLNFARIFDFDSEEEEDEEADEEDQDREEEDDEPAPGEEGYETDTRPSSRRSSSSTGKDEDEDERTPQPSPTVALRPTRLRRPSIRTSSGRPSLEAPVPRRSSGTAPSGTTRSRSTSRPPSSAASSSATAAARPACKTSASNAMPVTATASRPVPDYDLSDEENLPSPFLKKCDRQTLTRTATQVNTTGTVAARAPRKSITLRAQTMVNWANTTAKGAGSAEKEKEKVRAARPTARTASLGVLGGAGAANATAGVRPSIAKAIRASEDAKKALSRP